MIKVKQIASHRNGVAANSFYVVLFTYRDGRVTRNMVAVLFEERGNIAVLDADMTAQGNVRFGENSWRGDDFERELRAAIAKAEA